MMKFLPMLQRICFNSEAGKYPLPSLSNILSASVISAGVSISFFRSNIYIKMYVIKFHFVKHIYEHSLIKYSRLIICKNPLKSSTPPFFAFISTTSLPSSSSVGFDPSDLKTVPKSALVIVPFEFLSNNENASWKS